MPFLLIKKGWSSYENMIYKNIETYEAPPSLIKYEPPLDITQKLEAYRQANFLPGSSDSKPSH